MSRYKILTRFELRTNSRRLPRVQQLEKEFNLDLEYREMGSLLIAENKKISFNQQQNQTELGLKIDLLDRNELKVEPNHQQTVSVEQATANKAI